MADRTSTQSYKTERFKAFVDAVVAIAMTLLILPLTESVAEAGAEGLSTIEFLDEHSGQLMSFLLSFFLIANFWMGHHRQYDEVIRVTRPLLLCNVLWMATIVWLPVPTAMLGQMDTDALQQTLYIGTLVLTQAVTLVGRVYVLRHPELTTASPSRVQHGAAADIATITLFVIALALSIPLGPRGYLALLLLVLTGPLARLVLRIWPGTHGEGVEPPRGDAADV
ncbi:TMEM175 family protein [Microbacterium hydrocarbonoxydans]|uniref:TMEM175 family protein n=1 Tax=Microbacterium hydrocarbonoxydans TaxID=273678 RepID=UPI0005ECB0A6|nr:TMEM175 family protein [Microbacterium hydrocarbonoxydans]